ncbi:MAG: FAD-dependent monooxygenase [Solirubrobacterales bacterium]|nr:FAD-dependent monooxygenase [Solirubrobacterales bacterium]
MKVLVIGGGIGGLSTTLALRRLGFEVDVVERDPEWGVYGVGIIQPGNALRALDSLGLAEACVDAGHRIVGDRTWLADGETKIAEHQWPALVEHLPPGNGLTRPKLHEILTSRTLESGADVRTGVTFTELVPSDDRVDATFTDGESRRYDFIVGADGLYSKVRERVFGAEPKPRFTGQVCWRYNLPRISGLEEIWMWFGPDGSAGFVPLGQDLMYILTIETPTPDQKEAIERDGAATVYRRRLAPFAGPVADVREQIVDDDAVVLRPIENIIVPAPWHRGRIVLLGDATHGATPHCGQGAAQAFEDAIVLAEELAKDVPVPVALEAFTERRYDRCRAIVEGSEQVGKWEQDHSLPIDPDATRNAVIMTAFAPI